MSVDGTIKDNVPGSHASYREGHIIDISIIDAAIVSIKVDISVICAVDDMAFSVRCVRQASRRRWQVG